jgi:hypothetical protein
LAVPILTQVTVAIDLVSMEYCVKHTGEICDNPLRILRYITGQ